MHQTKQTSAQKLIEAFLAVSRLLKSNLSYKSPLMHLPLAQMQTLLFVSEQKQATMKAVADFLYITPPSATALVNCLADQEYIHRMADPHDRRTIHLKLTKKGDRVLKKARSEHTRRLSRLFDKLSKKEQTSFVLLLNKMI